MTRLLGETHSRRINTLVEAMLRYGRQTGEVGLEEETEAAMLELRDFMFRRVYLNPVAKGEEYKGQGILQQLYYYFVEHADDLPRTICRSPWRKAPSGPPATMWRA